MRISKNINILRMCEHFELQQIVLRQDGEAVVSVNLFDCSFTKKM